MNELIKLMNKNTTAKTQLNEFACCILIAKLR